ncbi:uncharacterized protein N7473_011434 [Penicillium subrubescens]|uniref:Uncharacterized protein n=1 Tax=Penicillium subrubescens TaxID=1316194 RepID=A0A1Q5UH61_9EURO|nr:uncharacterized protein N7473_011434 [Penicillium subrubescens]KAJ5880381.1 hypothetical protein N7473_011434 [Penicillium subrubescens]OKP11801.1 hypothetical protein PENSUB_2667 [Penicillium subrubescens]
MANFAKSKRICSNFLAGRPRAAIGFKMDHHFILFQSRRALRQLHPGHQQQPAIPSKPHRKSQSANRSRPGPSLGCTEIFLGTVMPSGPRIARTVEHEVGGAGGGGQSGAADNGQEIKRREEKAERRKWKGPPPELLKGPSNKGLSLRPKESSVC